ncbi:MAG: AMP-binding protein [Alphaproteobacteria bacterium]|nr:AMP-binding protein [Alphaproteobacteria bacterium]MDP6517345.1 AMP-binding protein [Alphaproteobacteria bacterium]
MSDQPDSSWTLLDAVRRQAARYGDRVLCTFGDGDRLTFRELETESDRLASAFAELGVEPGDRVMALAFNCKAFLLAMIAVQKRGAIFVPINTELKGAFLEHQVRNIEPRVIIVEAELRPAFDTISVSGVPIETTVLIGEAAPPVAGTRLVPFADLDRAVARPEDVLPAAPSDICMILFTSGTTGPSKGVLMPHAHCYLFGFGAGRAMAMGEDDQMYVCMPFFHAMGLLLQFVSCLIYGAPAHVVRRFSASAWLDDVRACAATLTYALGVIPEFIFRQPSRPEDPDNRLRVVVAVPVGEEWGAAFERRFDLRLMQAYGMTECNIPALGDLEDPVMAGCAGPIIDDFFEVRVADPDTDLPLPTNETGEILVRPKQPSCFMAGYFRMPERTVESWRNLWFHTGDAGRMDESGRLFFIDRIKDCIRRRGENISAFEIEQVLNGSPGVAESAVVGIRTPGAGGEEEVKACIVAEGAAPDPAVLIDWCAARMPRYAVPRYVEFVAALEKTATGKHRKQALRDAGVTAATWDRDAAGAPAGGSTAA